MMDRTILGKILIMEKCQGYTNIYFIIKEFNSYNILI